MPETRAAYARTNADLTVNDPDGFPSDFPPVWWIGTDQLTLNGSWNHGGWNDPLNTRTAPDQAVVTRATSLIVGPLSASPYRVVSDGTIGQPVPSPTWIRDPMLLKPDARVVDSIYPSVLRLSRSAFWGGLVRNALWYGLGAFLFIPDTTGQPLAGTLRLVDPRFMSTQRDDSGALCWSVDDGGGAPAIFDRDGTIRFGAVEYRLAVLRNPLSPIDIEGMSQGVFSMNPTTFALGSQISHYMSGVYRSGIPAGYLKVDLPSLTQPQSDELKSKWLTQHGGSQRSIAVLNATTSFVPLQYSPEDAAVGESSKLQIASAAFAFGLDPVTLNVSMAGSSTYNNVRDAWVNHRDYGLSPWIVALQDVLSALVPGPAGVVVVLDSFANPPLSERVATGAAAVKAGLMEVDEWRALEGLPPLPKPEPAPEPPVLVPVPDPTQGPSPAPEPAPSRRMSWRS